MSRRTATLSSLPGAIRFLALAAAFVILASWSWRRWPDLLVDFGQQLYIPWRLASGERLHQEITLLHGPLSQYLNAFWFVLFGPSLTVLVLVNLAILGLLTWLVYRIVRLIAGPLAATACGLVLLCVFGFSQYVGQGNYNFITPYTHESTHGVVLAAGMILALSLALVRGGGRRWGIAGLCLGLAALTKAEVALAAMATAVLGLSCGVLIGRLRPRLLLWFAGGALAPGAAFFLYFVSYLPAGLALRAVGGGFAALSSEVARNPFYMRVAGLDDPFGNLRQILVMAGVVVALGLVALATDALARRTRREPAAIALAAGAVAFFVLMLKPDLLPWRELPRALPLTTAAALIGLLALFWNSRADEERRGPVIAALLSTTFALALLSKAALNLHVYHYGFYLALPATLVLLVAGLEGIPRLLQERFGGGVVFKALAIALVAVGTIYHLGWSREIYGLKNHVVGRGGDAIVTYGPAYRTAGPAVEGALRWLEENTSPDDTLVGFPEGIMLNYLARRATRTTCMNFMMTEMILFGEKELLAALRADPPDYVLLVHKDTREFGAGFFGRDPRYGRAIMKWVEEEYEPRALFGDEPLRDDRFGIKILERTSSP